jgi:hypothetical protein
MFFKRTPSEKKYSQDNFRGIHTFVKIPIVKVLFSNLLSKKGMSYVTYPVRERVKLGIIKSCNCFLTSLYMNIAACHESFSADTIFVEYLDLDPVIVLM